MRLNSAVSDNEQRTLAASLLTPHPRRSTGFALAAGLAAVLALAAPHGVAADNDQRGQECSNRILRGEYGFLVSGTRGIGPIATETFVGVGLRIYDGSGGLTDKGTFHGQVTGVQGGEGEDAVTGTYQVNGDCTGTTTVFIPNVPFPIVSNFVIVDKGRQVKEVVVSPASNVVTAVLDRM
jgi:hypothetical protein